jgi:hypothetical protein
LRIGLSGLEGAIRVRVKLFVVHPRIYFAATTSLKKNFNDERKENNMKLDAHRLNFLHRFSSGKLASGVSPAAGQKNGRSDRKRNFITT